MLIFYFSWNKQRTVDYTLYVNYTAYSFEAMEMELNRFITWPDKLAHTKLEISRWRTFWKSRNRIMTLYFYILLYLLFLYSILFKIESTVHVKISCSWSVWHDFNWTKHYRNIMYNIFCIPFLCRYTIRHSRFSLTDSYEWCCTHVRFRNFNKWIDRGSQSKAYLILVYFRKWKLHMADFFTY